MDRDQFQDANSTAPSSAMLTRWLWRLWVVFCTILIATALVPLLPVNWWWVRIGDFPRVQLLVSYLLALLLLIPVRDRRVAQALAGLLIVGVAIQLYWVFPYLPLAPNEVQQAESNDDRSRLRILTANIYQENENSEAILKLIDELKPDVVVLCEVNNRWIAELGALEEKFAYHLTHPLDNTYGIAFYTNLKVNTARVRTLVKEGIPSIDAKIELPNGHEVRLFAVHPNPPRPGESTRKRDAELVLAGREVRDDPSAIVLGDMNDVGWSRTTNLFQEVSGLLDPRKGRGLFPTYNANSWFLRYPLDHLFHSDDFRVVQLQTLRDVGSDHFPLLAELSWEPAASDDQEAPDLDAGDQEDAQDAVEAVR